MRRDWPLAGGLIAGAIVDAAVGDPARGHPVALFGRVMATVEQRVYADRAGRWIAYAAAGVFAGAAPLLLAAQATQGRPAARAALTAATTWAVIAARSLGAAALQIENALTAGDLTRARAALPCLCGRDPQDLGAAAITRAVVESVAENTSDAIVAPLIWERSPGRPVRVPGRQHPRRHGRPSLTAL